MNTQNLEIFKTRKLAREHIATLRGWPTAKAVHLEGIGWVVLCGDKYLRTTGYIS